jgi:hypothetical protein
MMRQDIMSRGMQTVPYYGFGGGNLDMFGIPSVRTPFTYFPQQTGLGQNFSLDQRRTIQPVNPTDPRVVYGDSGGGGSGGNIGGGGRTIDLSEFISGAYPPGGTQMFGGFGGLGGFGGGFNDITNVRTPLDTGNFSQPDIQTSMRTPIVSRSAQVRGTPNVMRRAEGGIADLLKK